MKVIIEKRLEAGKYFVRIDISDYTNDEVEKIKKFGSPRISVAPKFVYLRNEGTKSTLPLHNMNYDFEFNLEHEAIAFVETMTGRIKNAVLILKNMKDNFSGKNELEL